MQIKCEAENYKYVKMGKKIIVFNSIYLSKTITVLLCALLSLMLPDIKLYYIPLAIDIDIDVVEKSNIKIDKKLNVLGTDFYSYFIPKEHYDKWKKTFRIVFWFIMIVELMLDSLLLYIFLVPSQLNLFAGLAFFCFFVIILCMGYKYFNQNRLIKKYQIREMKIEK